ncbi:MAG: histidine phosphotransferase family protein, partial [Pseudomonadota bacterium]
INPVGAVSSGLEVLDDAEMDQTMQDAAMDLIRTGASKAIALLTYARLAYGAAGGFGAQINLDDAKKAMEGVFASAKADLEWRIGEGYGPKENVKTLLILGHAASESVPRGGVVRIEGDIANFRIEATGKKVLLQDDFVRALGGDSSDLTPKFSPAFIVSKLAKEAGARVRARLDGEMAIFEANFPE